jgi:primosomal protein N' (replication factor Y) (superfamily II helicase)
VFARVAFPAALPEALSYAVPDELVAAVHPGVRVRARMRGVPRVGLVTECADGPGCDPARVLPLDEVLDADPVVPAAVLDLMRFASRYYFAPIGTVVRTAVPASLLRLPPAVVKVGPRAAELAASVAGEELRLLERLLDARRITVARLLAEGWRRETLAPLLERLASRKALTVVERRPRVHAGATVTAVTLVELTPDERAAIVGAAPAQQRVVAWLEDLGRPELEAELRAACRCSAGVIGELVRKGALRRFQQRRQATRRRWELAAPPPVERLSRHQEAALAALRRSLAAERFSATLLLGVTGSGKTEVYLRLAADVVAAGRKALVLVPEIGLTPALAGQLAARFGERVAVVHSSMAEGERFAAWDRARRGEVDVVAGPRSALWAPLSPLGLVVVDEEQDASYKQDEEPRYHARDLALVLGKRLGIPVVLASATPSMETMWLARKGRLEVIDLPERVAGGRLPSIEVLDLRGAEGDPGEHGLTLVSPTLRARLEASLERREQAILLVNRRGWAPVLLCRECGHQVTCRDCSIALTVHRRSRVLACHYCGFSRDIPESCPRCSGRVLDHVGAGTEKVAERVRELFPAARVDILDRDTVRSPAALLTTLERFAAGESDVLVGTQMVSKGHHFPRVTLTAVINCDNLLGYPDFRGSERTYHMLTQAAGRAGRGEAPGDVLFQTYHPDHYAIVAAATHDMATFAAEELRYRQAFRYPPCRRMALVRCEAEREMAAWRAAEACAAAVEPLPSGVRLVGPAPAPLARLRGRFRVLFMLFAPARPALRAALERVSAVTIPRGVHRIVDVDPQSTV